jgi:hypothetical protein
MAQLNTFADVAALALAVQHDAVFIERDTNFMPGIVTAFGDMSGGNERKNYQYNEGVAKTVGEDDDLTSEAFTPALLSTLTPGEIGLQFFLTDKRVESDLPENIRNDAAQELGFAARDRIESDLLGQFVNLTGGTVGAAGTIITWGYVFAAATVCRASMKNRGLPLNLVLHEYQWHVLAKAASIAGITLAQIPDRIVGGSAWYMGTVLGANINCFATTNITIDSNVDARGAIFARPAIAYDVRRPIRIEPERDASRRGWELNMSALYAHGVWRPKFGVQLLFDAAVPES